MTEPHCFMDAAAVLQPSNVHDTAEIA